MAPSTTNVGKKKEKIFHPNSRKAGQLNRTQNRKSKLADQAASRVKRHASAVDFYGFFYHALPEQGGLSLDELHKLIRDVWLTRHNAGIEEEQANRRKGRPKSVRQQKLEEIKLHDEEEYRTGLEVPDLTHPANVELFRQWDQMDFAFTQILRFIRISSADPTSILVSRAGKHHTLVNPADADAAMDASP